jgi:TctA family transporter
MKKLFWTIFALATALVSLLPGVSEAGKNLNRNQTLLRGCARFWTIFALAASLVPWLPGVSKAGTNLNHNQTCLEP